jgi:hypothetical protein
MPRIVKGIAVALAVVVGAVAAFFGALVAGAILLVVALFALLGRGRVKVTVNRGPGASGPGARRAGAATGPMSSGGDVIDIEARKVETPPELK